MSCPTPEEPQHIAVPPENPDDSARELEVEGLAAGGRGVARADGQVWFLPGALPGDRVLAAPRRRHPRYVEGRVLRRLEASALRREPACPLQSACGGCPWMPLAEAEQRRWKRSVVADALHRIAGQPVAVEEVRASPRSLGYRNKTELTLGRDAKGRPAIGFHAADPGAGLIDVGCCPLQTDSANAVLATARDFLLARADGWVGAAREGVEPFRLVVRTSRATGEALVAIRETSRPFKDAASLAGRLAEAHTELAGVVRIRARSGRRGGARVVPVRGKPWITERIGKVSYRLPAASFLQVNPEAAELLAELVRRAAGPVERSAAIDLYGGVGVFAFGLARGGAHVTVCEADVDAVRCGRRTARTVGIDRVSFHHADVTAFLRDVLHEGRRADVVVANPPRTGLGRRVPQQIAQLGPHRVVLVSCDPATLARDTRRLIAAGFRVDRVIPVDVFPQTARVETVLSLTRS